MSNAETQQRADYTEGSIIGSILKMGLPSMFGFLVQHLYAMADMFWVSRLPEGESGVAAITFFTNMLWMMFAFNALVGPGSVAIISRRYGEKAFDEAEAAIKQTIFLKLFFGGLLGLVGWLTLPQVLPILGATDEALAKGISYGRIMLIGLPISFAAYSIFTGFRGVANPNLAMGLMVGSNVLNALLDPIFMFGWGGLPAMGIEGAAWASVTSYVITFGVGLLFFRSRWTNLKLRITWADKTWWPAMWKIVRIGIPAWLGDLSFSSSRLLITPIVAGFGTPVVAAYGVGSQLFAFGIMTVVGIGLGLSSLIGHNLGSGKLERAKATGDRAILVGIGIMLPLSAFCFYFAQQYMSWFFTNEATIAHGEELVRIMAIGIPFFGAFIMTEMIHQGVGLNTPTMVVSIIHSWGFQVLPAVIATQFLDLDQTAVWWILSLSAVISSTGFYFYYRRGHWLQAKV